MEKTEKLFQGLFWWRKKIVISFVSNSISHEIDETRHNE